jgi:putative membrane protein
MKNLKLLISIGAIAFAFAACANVFAQDGIDADDFVDEASAAGVAEIETAKIALQKSKSSAVRTFAQQMITDHTAANSELKAIATRKKLDVADEAELMNKARAFILRQRDGESFDVAYANNQVDAHVRTIELFQDGSRSTDADIKAFATKTLPKLQHHLEKARELATTTKRAEGISDNDNTTRDRNNDINTGTMQRDHDGSETPHRDTGTDAQDNTNSRPGMGTVPQTQRN